MLTFNDVNRDFKTIIDGVSDANRPVPSTLEALKVSSVMPLIGIIFSATGFWAVSAQMNHQSMTLSLLLDGFLSGDAIPVYMSLVVGFMQMIMVLPYIILYHSIPIGIRKNTALIASLKKAVNKGAFIYVVLLLTSCLISFNNSMFLFSTPIIMFVAVLITSLIVNLQITKYGVGALIEKLKNILN